MTRILTDWIASYLEYTKASEAPESFHKWTAISTIAGALRGRVWFYMSRAFSWRTNFYIIFVAPPGIATKSTTAGIGEKLLFQLGTIKRGPSSSNGPAIVKALAESREDMLLPDGSYSPLCALNFSVSELGTFLKVIDSEMMNFLTDMWDGKQDIPWEKYLKGEGESVIINPFMNIIGSTTPSWAMENMTGFFMGGGFASRTIFVYQEKKRRLLAYPYLYEATDLDKQEADLLTDLKEISNLYGAFKLTGKAEEWGTKWYERHWTDGYDHIKDDFKNYLARKQAHLHKVAMVRSVSLGNDLVITEEHLSWAELETTRLEENFSMIFQNKTFNPKMNLQGDILRLIKQAGGRMNKAKLYQQFINTISSAEFGEIVNSMIYAEMLLDVPPYLELPDFYKGE